MIEFLDPGRVNAARPEDVTRGSESDSQFASFCGVAGRGDLAADPRFSTNPQRVRNRGVLIPIVQEIVRQRSKGDWIDVLEAAGVPCGPINNMQEVFANPQVQHRGMHVDIPHPAGVPCATVASPMRFSETPVTYDVPPPLLGQHTREVLTSVLGLGDDEIAALSAQGVV